MCRCIVDTLPEITNFWKNFLPSYQTFTTAKIKIKLPSHFCLNCCDWRRDKFLKQVLLNSFNFFRTATFKIKVLPQKRYFFRTASFLEEQIFEYCYFFRKAIERLLFQKSYLHSSNVFRRATFSQHTFSEEVLFRSCTSYLLIKFVRHQLRTVIVWEFSGVSCIKVPS